MVASRDSAKIDKGKKYDKVREPIMIYIFVPVTELQEVETYLAYNRYFDYTGILVFPTDIMPSLDQNGRIIFRDKESISFSSIGSGGFFHCLKKDGLLGHMKSHGIEFAQVLNMEHVNATIMNAPLLGYLATNADDTNMIAEMSTTEPGYIENPTIIYDKKAGALKYATSFAQFKMSNQEGKPYMARYHLHSTNCYLKVSFIEDALLKHKGDIFQYCKITLGIA